MNLHDIFNFKNKVILITGCNGQVGRALCNLYCDLDAKVYGVDFHQNRFVKGLDINYIQCDLNIERNIKILLENIFKKKKVDVIINNAADSVFSNFKKGLRKRFHKYLISIHLLLSKLLNIIQFY